MYKLINSELNEMNEKQVKLNEFMIAFEKKSPLMLIAATAVNVTLVKKHPEASVLSILKLASPLSMHNAARVKRCFLFRSVVGSVFCKSARCP